MERPVFELLINEDLEMKQEVNAVALVDAPAIGKPFFAFKETPQYFVNEDEKIVIGPAMIPELRIFRRDETGEYDVYFSKQTIEKIALKFFAKGFQQSANEMHKTPVEGVTFFMSWIADRAKGVPPMEQFADLPDGTWFLGAKVDNEETWAKVKDGTFTGWSVEGIFDMIKVSDEAEIKVAQLRELLRNI